MTATERKIETLGAALRQAAAAAEKHADANDLGTCNLDAAVFWPGKEYQSGTILKAAEAAGVRVSISSWFGRCVFVLVSSGQGYRRTLMARAASDALRQAGLDASVFYQID